jgi:hypothetical protein
MITVVSVKAILRPGPQEACPILQNGLHTQILQALIFPVKLKVVTLRDCRWREKTNGREGDQ